MCCSIYIFYASINRKKQHFTVLKISMHYHSIFRYAWINMQCKFFNFYFKLLISTFQKFQSIYIYTVIWLYSRNSRLRWRFPCPPRERRLQAAPGAHLKHLRYPNKKNWGAPSGLKTFAGPWGFRIWAYFWYWTTGKRCL